MAEAYPLHWPVGWSRTQRKTRSALKTSLATARDMLMHEIKLMGARYPVLSTNIPLRRDGLPYAGQANPDDCGVAVYFEYGGRQMTFACDRWDRVQDNVQAIRKTIEAIRGIERWGASDMMERAFSAFEALPSPEMVKQWWHVLGVNDRNTGKDEIERAYRAKARTCHPDTGGSTAQMAELNVAREAALKACSMAS